MKILITGGAGFQGSHLVESLLERGHEVSILNTFSDEARRNTASLSSSVHRIWGSITDAELVEKSVRGHDVVFHMAARINVDESLVNPLSFLNVNVLGTHHVLEAIRRNGGRLIYASTCEIYGDGHALKEGELLNESAELRPNSPYAASKAAADRLCHSYFRSFGTDVVIVRPFNIFGERQKSGRFGALIPILVSRALRGEPLTVFGTGDATRDYLHVQDIVQGYRLALETPSLKGRAINFASGRNIKIKDIIDFIARELRAPVVHAEARPGEVSRFPADISLARSFGFSPRVDIWEGIGRYIEWSKKQL
ncbi:MAG: NAD-dependent epimerase/dehydratase family protein [Candidatus Niyogibacteria bacterium]|nr:NAD-dependent epimerase/dehydratase family protein [Candidatus Niyogibacteria bacterium]